MEREGAHCPVPCKPRASALCAAGVLVPVALALLGVFLLQRVDWRLQQLELRPPDAAELQLDLTGSRQDPRLRWQAGPALGRSFLHGPALDHGQLHVRRDGIYRLHIQVTLANCSSTGATWPHQATLSLGICAPATHSITLLSHSFGHACTVSAQRLTPLVRGDVLCANLTLPLRPSPNAYETFFGIQEVHL